MPGPCCRCPPASRRYSMGQFPCLRLSVCVVVEVHHSLAIGTTMPPKIDQSCDALFKPLAMPKSSVIRLLGLYATAVSNCAVSAVPPRRVPDSSAVELHCSTTGTENDADR